MRPATWGKNPFYMPVSDTYNSGEKKGQSRNSITSGNMEWDLGGWHYKRRSGWANKPKKGTTVRKVQRRAPDGHIVTAYMSEGYDDYMTFRAHSSDDERAQDAIAFAEVAFDTDKSHDVVFESDGAGHIKHLKWAKKAKVLSVTFRDGTECLFFKVPSAVAGTLLAIANVESKNPDTGMPHNLGKYFWSMVRIRGHHTGARYPFEYSKHGNYLITGRGDRHMVTLTAENMMKIFGSVRNTPAGYKPGDKITTILTEEEYQKYVANKDAFEHESSSLSGVHDDKRRDKDDGKEFGSGFYVDDSDPYSRERDKVAYEQTLEYATKNKWETDELLRALEKDKLLYLWEQDHPGSLQQGPVDAWQPNGTLTSAEAKRLGELNKQMESAADRRVENLRLAADKKILDWKTQNAAEAAALDQLFGYDDESREKLMALRKRAGVSDDFSTRDRGAGYDLKARLRKGPMGTDLGDQETRSEYNRLVQKEDPAKYARRFVYKRWTPEQLASMTEHIGEPGYLTAKDDIELYKSFIDTGQYDKALNYLKNNGKNRVYRKTKFGEKKLVMLRRYAGADDIVDYDSKE